MFQKSKSICAKPTNNRKRILIMSGKTSVGERPRALEGMFSAIGAGFVFILFGIIYITTPGIWQRIIDFLSNLTTTVVPNIPSVYLPVPIHPNAHAVLYDAVFRFCLGVGILQIVILALRFGLRSPVFRASETVGNLVFWFGAAYLVNTHLNSTTTTNTWFAFWAGILIILGISLIARSLVLLAVRHRR
jgi:hypothetical protein